MMNGPRDHINPVPPYFQIIRFVQIGLAAVVLALTIYGASSLPWWSGGAGAYGIFVGVATFVIVGYYLLSTMKFITLYNRIAVLILECFLVVWWLSTWTSLAAAATIYSLADVAICNDFGNCYSNSWVTSYRDAYGAAAGIGALNFILFIFTLVIFSIHFHRQRLAGAPYSYRGVWANGATNGSGQGGPGQRAVPMQSGPYDAQKSGAPEAVV